MPAVLSRHSHVFWKDCGRSFGHNGHTCHLQPLSLSSSGYKYRATFAAYEKSAFLYAEAAHIWLNTLPDTSSVRSPAANKHFLPSTKHVGNRPITKNIAH